MKVKDLIRQLTKLNPEAYVFVDDLAGHSDERFDIERLVDGVSPDGLDFIVLIQIDSDQYE